MNGVVSSEALVRLQGHALTMLVAAPQGDTIAADLLPVLGDELACVACGLWMAEGDRLVVRATWYAESYVVPIEGATRATAVWTSGQPLANEDGIWIPIQFGAHAIGVYELRQSAAPALTPEGLETLATIGRVIARYIVNSRDRAALREGQEKALAHVETLLRATQTKLAHLEQSGVIGIITSGLDGVIIDSNDAFLEMFQATREDLVARRIRWNNRTPPEWEAADQHAVQQLVTTGVAHAYEKEFLRADGSRLSVIVGAAVSSPELMRAVCFVLDITERKRAERELERLNTELETRVLERTAQLEAHRERLAESERQLRALAGRLLSVREEERATLAREIHDVLGQELTGLKMDASWLVRRIDQPVTDTEPTRDRLRCMMNAIENLIGTVRRIATDLRPGVLDDLGLIAALEWYARDFGSRAGLAVTIKTPPQLTMDRDLATALFRITQELFTNVVRHAEATSIQLTLTPTCDALELGVRDDGIGVPAAAMSASGSLGLLGIRERALAFGGSFMLRPHDQRGTEAIVRIPVSSAWAP
jgi:PAS domain S-box-containing protein